METLAMMLMFVPALIASVVAAANAKKVNAAWRERRAVKAAAR